MSSRLVWFRRDLRIHDNAALSSAVRTGGIVIPVYIYAPEEERNWAPGAASRWWLHHSLAVLADSLHRLGMKLVIRRGDSLARLQELIGETGADEVHWNRLFDPAICKRDASIRDQLEKAGITAKSHAGALLVEPWDIATEAGTPYRVFTPFWRKWQACMNVKTPHPLPAIQSAGDDEPASVPLQDLGLLPGMRWADGFRDYWQPGETGALQRLEEFCKQSAADYAAKRDYPAYDAASRLSPHLHFGEISPAQTIRALRATGMGGAQNYIRQLAWREFAHSILYHFPRSCDEPLSDTFRRFPWRTEVEEDLLAWQRGMTGYPLVDAGMRQLWKSGWMHNRVRMVAASFLVKNLRIPWQRGAKWFWDTLLDADLANNTMGWQWCAGSGADAAPYFRIFNPVTQSEKFDTAGVYLRHWLPELKKLPDKWLHRPWQTPPKLQRETGFAPGRDYPLPMTDYRASRQQALAAYESMRADMQ